MTSRRRLTMDVIEALDTVINNDAMSQYELADAVVEMLLERYGLTEEDPERAREHRPDADADEHHSEEPESLATLRSLLADNGAGWLDDYLRRRLGGDTFAEAVYAADQHASIHPSPAEPGPLEGVDLRTGQPIPDSCISTGALSHWWFEGADVQAVNGFVWSPGPGPHQRCSRCGAVRIKR